MLVTIATVICSTMLVRHVIANASPSSNQHLASFSGDHYGLHDHRPPPQRQIPPTRIVTWPMLWSR